MKFVRIEAGEFIMGSPLGEHDRNPDETQHRVKLTKPFMMATTVVTQPLWKSVMGDNRSHLKGDNLPVESVTWEEAIGFCKKLSAREGKKYRLPTEAEWEYACRAGTTTAYYTGDGNTALDEAGWYIANSENHIHPVGQKKPNAWGLYDMHGNVWQWCGDWYGDYPEGEVSDPPGAAEGASRVLRGGSCGHDGRGLCRAALRSGSTPGNRITNAGFRLCRDL